MAENSWQPLPYGLAPDYTKYLLLSSSTYFVFLVALFFLYWPIARFRAAALTLILFANYFFYARWDLTYLALIPAASSCDYAIGLGLQQMSQPWVRRALVTCSVLMNLGLLAFFKYTPFALANYSAWTGQPAGEWHWALPVTLSFYVFQSLTYTIDLYRRDIRGTRSYLTHLASVSFFPTTLAGPITRVQSLVDQFEKRKLLEASDGGRALFLIGMGLVKKLMIADFLASNLIDRVFDFPNLYSSTEVLVTVYGYALQLYYDFSGYTDIAIGSALLLGIKLPANFNRPYAAINIADFWQRWHITLSHWLRDYLFFSLPGHRSKWKFVIYLNLIVTMVLGGLWHGASWNFVIWGALHGFALAGVRLVRVWRGLPRGYQPSRWGALAGTFLTFHFVTFAWIFFRASSFELATTMLARIADWDVGFENVSGPLWMVLAIGLIAHYLPKNWYEFSLNLYVRAPFYAQAAAMALLVAGLQYVAATGATPFIYNQF